MPRTGRRGFLRGLGAAAVGTGTATAAPGGDGNGGGSGEGPSEFTGHRIHRFEPNGETYRHVEQFVGRGLAAEYGVNRMEYDLPDLPREAVERALPEARENPGTVVEVRKTDTAVIGTFEELTRFERAKRDRRGESARGGTGIDAGAYYTGPIYHYNSNTSDPTLSDLGEPKAPINVGWESWVEPDARGVAKRMYDDLGWGGWLEDPIFKNTRYIIVDYGDYSVVKGNDTDATDAILLSKQWHVRLYSLSYTEDDYSVIGQAHKDPYLHDGPPWSFVESRRKVTGDWGGVGYPTEASWLYNGWRWDTSDGYMGQVG